MTSIAVFVATAYALSIALSLVVGLTGGQGSRLSGLAWVTMFLPAIAVLAVRVTRNEPLGVRWDRFPVKYLPIALLLMPGILHAVALPLRAAMDGGIEWQDWLTPGADGLCHTAGSRGWGVLTAQGLARRILVNAVAAVAVVSLLAFFEEIGWRAWLLPRLLGRIGARRAVIATSIV